jgi:hypothetical protein
MIGIYIVLGFVVVGAIALIFFYHQKRLKMTSTTVAEVVRSDQREVRDEQERRDETVVRVRYKVGGQTYEAEQVLRGRQAARYPAGRTLTVHYNPAEPEMSRLDMK